MTVHLFGAVSSPSCASYALRKSADDHQSEFTASVCQAVKQNFYVDDSLKRGCYSDLTALCKKGGFALEKWISNNRDVLQAITTKQRA